MIELDYEMTYSETIDGPLGPTAGSPTGARLCWQVTTATLTGPRINATLAMPGVDWIRLGDDGIRRQDLRAQLMTDDDTLILLHYDLAMIRSTERFLAALQHGQPTEFADQYMRIAPQFEVGAGRYRCCKRACSSEKGGSADPKRSPTTSIASCNTVNTI
jgi:hypothetical protein